MPSFTLEAIAPLIVGQDFKQASAFLAQKGLTLTVAHEQASDEQAGIILKLIPETGTVSPGSTVQVVVSSGRAPVQTNPGVEVPDLVGRSLESARTILTGLGLELDVLSSRPAEAPAGSILEQIPSAGSNSNRGSRVAVVVAEAVAKATPVEPDHPLPPPAAESQAPTDVPGNAPRPAQGPLDQLKLPLLIIGGVLLLIILVVAVFIPNPTGFQYTVFRTTLALGVACVAASLPGFFQLEPGLERAGISAGGALGIFVLVYWWNPSKLIGTTQGPGGTAEPPGPPS